MNEIPHFIWPSDQDRAENDELNRVCEYAEELLDQLQGDAEPESICPRCKGKGRHVTGPIDCPAIQVCRTCSETGCAHPQPPSAGVPEGWKLVPEFMTLDFHGLEMIKVMTGDGEDEEDFTECVLWVGGIHGDDGEQESYGLNIACAECFQEGFVTVVPFDAPQPPKQEGSDDE
ncbi:hypothetical protein [Marinobacter sp. MDS2]|uniref:hypothetical protein n=1 Tax=Marinobacter sp. MDS2 TaxID=3065961 RepID=UPI00273BC0EF|nr:hypothetical protein [Marinobacter sp. MDS2]MDP4546531.1 hypothetical protein [Marinobacter sp. MDS2]